MVRLIALALAVQFFVVVIHAQEFIGFGKQRLQGHRNNGKSLLRASVAATNCDDVEQLWFDGAVVDNFAGEMSQQNWRQRYWLNKKNWAGIGAPIFVFIGGEGEESCGRLSSRMFMFDLAVQHGALLVDVEHRFYGQSMPTNDASTKSLSLLTSEQALADLARIIQKIKKDLQSETSKVITIGGSYPGNLAAYFRLKYPSVTSGSIASSAPVRAQTNFPEYMEVVSQALEYFSGQKCVNAFQTAAEKVAELAAQGMGSSGMKQLEKDFHTCSPVKSKFDLAVLMSDLMGNVQGVVQYNNEHNGVLNVTDICTSMLKTDDSYANFVELSGQFREINGVQCEDASFEDTLSFLGNASYVLPANAARSWTYQTCNEFGYFQTTSSPNQPFYSWRELDLTFSMAICYGAFSGWNKEPSVDWTNTLYGAEKIDATKIVFTSGTIDPWHALGVTNYTSKLPQTSEYPVYITGTAHCNDLYAPNAQSDPPSLTYARQIVASKVGEFLA